MKEIEHPADVAYFRQLDEDYDYQEAIDKEIDAIFLELCEDTADAHELRMTVFDAYVQDVAGVKSDDCRVVALLLDGRIDEAVELAKEIANNSEFIGQVKSIAASRIEAERENSEPDSPDWD
jgi:hypothetical protein